MSARTRVIVCLLVLQLVAAARADELDGASWVWSDNANRAGVVYIGTRFELPAGAAVRSASALVTADNLFAVYLNGKSLGASDVNDSAWTRPRLFDATTLLAPGLNTLIAQAVNTTDGSAGLVLKLTVELDNGQQVVVATDGNWKCTAKPSQNWRGADVEEEHWSTVQVLAGYGLGVWGRIDHRASLEPPGRGVKRIDAAASELLRRIADTSVVTAPPADFRWPQGVLFVGDDCSLYPNSGGGALSSLNVTVFTARRSRAFPEHDLPSPVKVGRKLFSLVPARPGVEPTLLLDAGRGGVGSPTVTFDGQHVLFAMAREGDAFFHVYRMPAAGGRVEQLTHGPFHDIDPVELPDGRICFVSTRIGRFEEYHSPPSRALFVMNPDGSKIEPITHTIIFDNEPRVMPDGRILFIRSDNFFDRGKVETMLHAIHPDGTHGYTEFALDKAPEYGGRLRAFYCGSPAPMPDGRVAFVSQHGLTIGHPGERPNLWRELLIPVGDVAATPDNRLIVTLGDASHNYSRIALLDERESLVLLHDSASTLHSVAYLGPQPRPPVMTTTVDRKRVGDPDATGVMFCQDMRVTQHNTAGWPHVRAVRVLAGRGLTVRSSHSYIVHAGSEVVELGTVPLAPDGSFAVRVPADTPIAFQAVDAEGRSELNEMSWVYVRPGETRGCVGCHQTRQDTPPEQGPSLQATQLPPLSLTGTGEPLRFRGNNAAVTGLMELQFDRYREVAGIDRVTDAADCSTRSDDVNRLLAHLRGADAAMKLSAAQRAALLRDEAFAAALAQCLSRREAPELRVAAAMALASCGTRQSVDALLTALDDPHPLAAQASAVALENLTAHTQPFDPFNRAERRATAAAWRQWFADNDWDSIERVLVERLSSPDRDAVRRAAVALGRIGGEPAKGALRRYVLAERDRNPYPQWRKHHRGDGARFNALSPANPRTLQAAVRALGTLRDEAAVPMLEETIAQHADPRTGNLFLVEAAVEALGRIATPAAEDALVRTLKALRPYHEYCLWYGDHDALIACHASPPHALILQALDAIGSTRGAEVAAELILSLPTDPDRALLPASDDVEVLTGRLLGRGGEAARVIDTCLALLGDDQASRDEGIEAALGKVYRAWAGRPEARIRAAQVLSAVCRDGAYEPRVRAAFERFRATTSDIPRVFDTGIPVVKKLPIRHWVCFYLARTLGHLGSSASVDALVAALNEPAEAATGRPDPLGPGVLFLHNDLTPCWRAAAAWALGRIGDRRAAPALLRVVGDLDNAIDTRHAAAVALGAIADPASLQSVRGLAADYPEVSTRQALLRAARAAELEP